MRDMGQWRKCESDTAREEKLREREKERKSES